jgi:hypothetical protein
VALRFFWLFLFVGAIDSEPTSSQDESSGNLAMVMNKVARFGQWLPHSNWKRGRFWRLSHSNLMEQCTYRSKLNIDLGKYTCRHIAGFLPLVRHFAVAAARPNMPIGKAASKASHSNAWAAVCYGVICSNRTGSLAPRRLALTSHHSYMIWFPDMIAPAKHIRDPFSGVVAADKFPLDVPVFL